MVMLTDMITYIYTVHVKYYDSVGSNERQQTLSFKPSMQGSQSNEEGCVGV